MAEEAGVAASRGKEVLGTKILRPWALTYPLRIAGLSKILSQINLRIKDITTFTEIMGQLLTQLQIEDFNDYTLKKLEIMEYICLSSGSRTCTSRIDRCNVLVHFGMNYLCMFAMTPWTEQKGLDSICVNLFDGRTKLDELGRTPWPRAVSMVKEPWLGFPKVRSLELTSSGSCFFFSRSYPLPQHCNKTSQLGSLVGFESSPKWLKTSRVPKRSFSLSGVVFLFFWVDFSV